MMLVAACGGVLPGCIIVKYVSNILQYNDIHDALPL